MQFHHTGYVSVDPRTQPASAVGENWDPELPDTMDVLIVGGGPTGMVTAAQLSMYPNLHTRIIDRGAERLEFGHADGVQARSMEMFQAFGFARRLDEEGYHITEMTTWKPDPQNPENIIRASRQDDDPLEISEFAHLTISQSRILDFFIEYMKHSPTRMEPNYGIEFVGLTVAEGEDYPVAVDIRYTHGPRAGEERTIRAKYVVGADGARSSVRTAIGRKLEGKQANHAWGVMDVLVNTDFPDIRLRSVVQSHQAGSMLIIPREGGYLVRLYVDLGEVTEERSRTIRQTTLQEVIDRANRVLHPYSVDIRNVVWNSVYEVGHRITDKFDDAPSEAEGESRLPRVFVAGDACHTHSAKAAQGMNVSMADGFNLAWKLGSVLSGRSPESLLASYSEERRIVAENLIEFDRRWSSLLAKRPEDFTNPEEVKDFVTQNAEFPAGFRTHYEPSMITGGDTHQDLAAGYTVGKRFRSEMVARVCDGNPLHLGHQAKADGRWRIYVFAGRDSSEVGSQVDSLAGWLAANPSSPVLKYTPRAESINARFELSLVYQQEHTGFNVPEAPSIFLPEVGPFRVRDVERVYAALPGTDIFETRGLSRDGVMVVVRPDQYVAQVLPLDATDELEAFFAQNMLPAQDSWADALS